MRVGRVLLGAAVMSLVAGAGAVPVGAASTFVVRSTSADADLVPGDGICDADAGVKIECTLPAAIQEANADPDQDRVEFLIGGATSTSVRTITLTAGLVVSEPLVIDGYTQPGSARNTAAVGSNAKLRIRLVGGGDFGISRAIRVEAPLEVKGLVFGAGIDLALSFEAGSNGSSVTGSFLGTSVSGLTRDPATGDVMRNDAIDILADDVRIGGTTRAARNVIVAYEEENASYTILVDGPAERAVIQGNLIGVAANGSTVLGRSEHAVFLIGTDGSLVGGTTAGAGNIIAGTTEAPVATVPDADDALGNRFLRNSIRTPHLPIDLEEDGVTPNDGLGDADSGDNGLQNHPVITSAKTGNGTTTIKGTLRSTPSRSFRIEVFSNPAGVQNTRVFLAAKTVTTDATGFVAWTIKPSATVAKGKAITATATDLADKQTSEVSPLRTVTKP